MERRLENIFRGNMSKWRLGDDKSVLRWILDDVRSVGLSEPVGNSPLVAVQSAQYRLFLIFVYFLEIKLFSNFDESCEIFSKNSKKKPPNKSTIKIL